MRHDHSYLDDPDDRPSAGEVLRRIERTMVEFDAEAAAEEQRELAERSAAATEQTAENTTKPLHRSAMSIREKSKFISQHGRDRYLKLPA